MKELKNIVAFLGLVYGFGLAADFNLQIQPTGGFHKGAYNQGYYGALIGVNIQHPDDNFNQWHLGFEYISGTIHQTKDRTGLLKLGYRLEQLGLSAGYERLLSQDIKLTSRALLRSYDYFSGVLDPKDKLDRGGLTEERVYVPGLMLGAYYQFIGLQFSIDTDLSLGAGVEFQIGR
jgi:hypothetical protein